MDRLLHIKKDKMATSFHFGMVDNRSVRHGDRIAR